ncbi:MAG TPA: hypothetical protein VHO95_02505 [Candidatus Dormibacteraeota bacterium]|jgi:hypothetical protein|nr:hypothetical protein [Candidatus Dormibacteraeota bacterium]
MKLQRLAGYGPAAAYVSALALAAFFLILITGNAIAQAVPVLIAPMTVVYLLALWLWLAAFAVVVFDLEWLEHPATSTRWFQVAHWATLVAAMAPVFLVLGLLIHSTFLSALAVLVIGVCVGVSMLVHNIDARRAGLLQGWLPWVGILSGVGFVLAGIGIPLSLPPLGFTGLIVGQVLYIAWGIWMGVTLTHAKRAAAAPASTTM